MILGLLRRVLLGGGAPSLSKDSVCFDSEGFFTQSKTAEGLGLRDCLARV